MVEQPKTALGLLNRPHIIKNVHNSGLYDYGYGAILLCHHY